MTTTMEPAQHTIDRLRHVYRDLHQLGLKLRESALRFQEMVRAGSFAENGRTFVYAPDEPRELLNRSIDITREFSFLVAVTGAFSSGKSTLLNLLLDQPDLLPASVIPMTAVCTVIRYGDQPRVRVRYVPLHVTQRGDEFFVEAIDRVQGPADARALLVALLGAGNLALPDEPKSGDPHCEDAWRPHAIPKWKAGRIPSPDSGRQCPAESPTKNTPSSAAGRSACGNQLPW